MLAELIQKVAGMERREYKYKIRPSLASPEIEEIGYKGRCKRQMVYHSLGYPEDTSSDRMQLVMDDSSWHEELTADWINKTTFQLRDRQFEIDCGYFGKGRIDGILTDIMGKDYLFEHKAINHFTFQRYDGDELPIDYIAQCCVYLNQELRDYDINQALLLIKNKNTAQYLEYLIQYNKEEDEAILVYKQNSIDREKTPLDIVIPRILARTREKFEFVRIKAEEKTLPKREYSLSDWQCEYCGWQKKCWEAYEEDFKNLNEDVELSNDIEERLGYYLELTMHLREMEKEKDEIKDEVMAILKEKDAKRAVTESYIITLSLIKSKRLDKEKIPADILRRAQVETMSERLNIRLKKEVKIGKATNDKD